MKFKKAPLIELIAEFRWSQAGLAGVVPQVEAGGPVTPIAVDPNRNEPFFSRFSERINRAGYTFAERLIPPGFFSPVHLPVLRYKHTSQGEEAPRLYQLGAGLFSAHALPPYKSWDEFKPVIETGLKVLLESRDKEEKSSAFTAISLRYIDKFTSELTGDLSRAKFIRNVLNLGLRVPDALSEEATAEDEIEPTLLLRVPLKSGLQMHLGINPRIADPDSGIVVDTVVVTTEPTPSDAEIALKVLESAHDSIRRVFLGLTEPITQLMEPE